MKTLGLIGGMSWESSKTYYAIINEMVREHLGGLHSARLVMISLDFYDLEPRLRAGDWDGITAILTQACQQANKAGAEALLIGSNTMHRVYDEVSGMLNIPCFHIATITGKALARDNHKKVGLLGTRFTMEQTFFVDELTKFYGIETILPDAAEMTEINRIIFEELCLGVISDMSRQTMLRIMDRLTLKGAEAIILGCTEIELLIKPKHTLIPLYDTTRLHAGAAVEWALDLPDGACR